MLSIYLDAQRVPGCSAQTWLLNTYLAAQLVVTDIGQAAAVYFGADDGLGQALQEQQQRFCHRVVAAH